MNSETAQSAARVEPIFMWRVLFDGDDPNDPGNLHLFATEEQAFAMLGDTPGNVTCALVTCPMTFTR